MGQTHDNKRLGEDVPFYDTDEEIEGELDVVGKKDATKLKDGPTLNFGSLTQAMLEDLDAKLSRLDVQLEETRKQNFVLDRVNRQLIVELDRKH